MNREAMQRRYDDLCAMVAREMSDEDRDEKTGLFFLLNPDKQYWREDDPDLNVEDVYPVLRKWTS